MKRIGALTRSVLHGLRSNVGDSHRIGAARLSTGHPQPGKVPLQKCLIVSKMTRYEYERHRHKYIPEDELELLLRKRGTDYDMLVDLHNLQKEFEKNVARTLSDMGMEVKVASRWSYNTELIKWCDVIIPCGGDGTFLLAASKVKDIDKPVIGFNSAPSRSVGRLCLPKWCSQDLRGAVQCLKESRFRWMHRTRIRTTITCEAKLENTITPVDLHTTHYSRYAAVCRSYETPEHVPPPEYLSTAAVGNRNGVATQLLPFLALNEVFIGESVSARVSHLQISVDGGDPTHTKSSGLCVTSGTGSTSWHLSINCLRTQSVQDLLRLIRAEYGVNVDTSVTKARALTEKYNKGLQFPPDSGRLAYSVRELIATEDWPAPRGLRARDFANSIRVTSHCVDAGLVIDGSVSFPFNDGTAALLQTLPEDSLRTVIMTDE